MEERVGVTAALGALTLTDRAVTGRADRTTRRGAALLLLREGAGGNASQYLRGASHALSLELADGSHRCPTARINPPGCRPIGTLGRGMQRINGSFQL